MTIMPVVGRVGQYVQETRILSDVMERYVSSIISWPVKLDVF